MGAIQIVDSGRRLPLRLRLRVGRAQDGEVVLSHPSVSRDHALIVWSGQSWEVRDLCSQNGTFVGAGRLPSGGRAEIGAGAVVTFASGGAVSLVDGSPPQPLALSDDGCVIEGHEGVLELPDDADPLSVWSDAAGAWWLEGASGEREVEDGEAVALGGRTFTLSLPEKTAVQPTARDVPSPAVPVRLRTGSFDPRERVLRRDGRSVSLSPMEARLLVFLSDRPGELATHRELLSSVWQYHQNVESRTVYATVNRLRHKIERDPTNPEHILSVQGLGYRFRPLD